MKFFALLPLATLLFAVAVSGDDDNSDEDMVAPPVVQAGNPNAELSVHSENEPSSTASSISYGGFGSPYDNESDEQPGKNVTVHYGGNNHTSYSTGRRHQRGRRVHSVHGSRHGARNSSRVSRHGSRLGGRQGLSSGRLSGGLGNIAKNIPGLSAGVPNLQNIAKNIPGIPSGMPNIQNFAKNIPGIPSGMPNNQNFAKNIPGIPSSSVDLGDLQGQDEYAAPV